MTVNEMIEMLQVIASDGNGDKDIVFLTDYGDYVHTQQALEPQNGWQGDAWGTVGIERSGYSHSGYRAVCGDTHIGICLDGGGLPEPDEDDDYEDEE